MSRKNYFNLKIYFRYPQASTVFGITICMSLLWMVRPIPLGITSLLPGKLILINLKIKNVFKKLFYFHYSQLIQGQEFQHFM